MILLLCVVGLWSCCLVWVLVWNSRFVRFAESFQVVCEKGTVPCRGSVLHVSLPAGESSDGGEASTKP